MKKKDDTEGFERFKELSDQSMLLARLHELLVRTVPGAEKVINTLKEKSADTARLFVELAKVDILAIKAFVRRLDSIIVRFSALLKRLAAIFSSKVTEKQREDLLSLLEKIENILQESSDIVPADDDLLFAIDKIISLRESLESGEFEGVDEDFKSIHDSLVVIFQHVLKSREAEKKTLEALESESSVNLAGRMTKDYSGSAHILMLTHEFAASKAGGVKTVCRKLVKYLNQHLDVDVIERSIAQEDSGTFYYYLKSSSNPVLQFRDMSYFFSKYPDLNLSLLHVQSINFAPGNNGWNNGGLDELRNMYHKMPVLCTIHSLVRHEAVLKNADWIKYSIVCQDQTIHLSDKFIVLHKFGRDLMKKYYPHVPQDSITIIPNGIDLDFRFKRKLHQVQKMSHRIFNKLLTLLFVGRVSEEKGLEELIRAMPGIKSHHPVRLLIIGPYEQGSYYVRLQQIARRSGLSVGTGDPSGEDVCFVGSIPHKELVSKVYEKFSPDMAILPSHHESFPLFALEAVAEGIPMVITDCDGPREVYSPFRVTDSVDKVRLKQDVDEIVNPLPGFDRPLAVAVDPREHESIVAAVNWVVDHPKEVHTILKNAMAKINSNYNWQSISRSTEKLYDSMLSHKKFHSPFSEEHVDEEFLKLQGHDVEDIKDVKVGIVGHFSFRDGSCPDGVARWNETLFAYLLSQGYSVEGYAFVGHARDNRGVVHFFHSKEIASAVEHSNLQLVVVRGDEKHAHAVIDACRRKGIPVIFVMPYWGVWKGAFAFAKKTDMLITGTEDYAMKIRAKTRTDTRYIPWPIDTKFWVRKPSDFLHSLKPDSWPKKTFNISYVGRLGTPKKVHNIIAPFKKFMIEEGHKDIRLIICGPAEEDMGDRLREEIRKHGVQDYVVYVEKYFSSEQVRDIYNSSDCFIFPSSFETYGQSNLEAISCQTPTVVPGITNFGDYAVPSMANLPGYEFAFKAGHLYDKEGKLHEEGTPHDWQDCFDKVLSIYKNPGSAAKIMKKWSVFIHNNMSADKVGAEFETALKDVYFKR